MIGLGLMGLSEPWIPSGVSFLWNLFTGVGLPLEIYILIGNIFIPLSLVFWMIGFANLVYPSKKKQLAIISIIIGLIFEILLFTLLFIDPSLIGTFSEEGGLVHIDIEYRTIVLAYLLFVVVTIVVSPITFGRKSYKSSDPEIKFKGMFLIIAPIVWAIGALLDSTIPLNLITLPITRVILVISSFLFLFGNILPKGVKNILIKQ